MSEFKIIRNKITQDFEIVLWRERPPPLVVQASIKTFDKAAKALRGWKKMAAADAENIKHPRPYGMPWDR